MKVVRETWTDKVYEASISDAVEGSCIDDSDGAVESVTRTAGNVARKLGDLIEILANKGLINEDELSNLINWPYKVEKD